jgi:hypothetical protein
MFWTVLALLCVGLVVGLLAIVFGIDEHHQHHA